MAKYKLITVNIFKRGIMIYIGNHNTFVRFVKEYFKDDSSYEDLVNFIRDSNYDNPAASCWFNRNTGEAIIELKRFPKTPSEIAIATHECLHAVIHVLYFCGVDFVPDGNNETYTYLLEHLVKNLLENKDYINIDL